MVICDNNPAEVGAIIGKGVIWLIALVCLGISGISTGRAATINSAPRVAEITKAMSDVRFGT